MYTNMNVYIYLFERTNVYIGWYAQVPAKAQLDIPTERFEMYITFACNQKLCYAISECTRAFPGTTRYTERESTSLTPQAKHIRLRCSLFLLHVDNRITAFGYVRIKNSLLSRSHTHAHLREQRTLSLIRSLDVQPEHDSTTAKSFPHAYTLSADCSNLPFDRVHPPSCPSYRLISFPR